MAETGKRYNKEFKDGVVRQRAERHQRGERPRDK